MTKEQIINQYISVYEGHAMEREELEIMLNGFADDIVNNLEPSLPDNLDEAAENHAKTKYGLTRLLGAEMREVEDDYKAGAKWQKNQMLKDAVEADVNTYKDPVLSCGWAEFVVDMPYSETDKLGDKVRIVVLKAEEE